MTAYHEIQEALTVLDKLEKLTSGYTMNANSKEVLLNRYTQATLGPLRSILNEALKTHVYFSDSLRFPIPAQERLDLARTIIQSVSGRGKTAL